MQKKCGNGLLEKQKSARNRFRATDKASWLEQRKEMKFYIINYFSQFLTIT